MLENLKTLRESKGYTQQQLAEKIGVSQQSIQKYETQKNEPDINSLKKIADIFEVSIDFLVGHQSPGTDPNYAISEKEFKLIECYRKIDTKNRNSVNQIIRALSGEEFRD